jgi:hypothetical protein
LATEAGLGALVAVPVEVVSAGVHGGFDQGPTQVLGAVEFLSGVKCHDA